MAAVAAMSAEATAVEPAAHLWRPGTVQMMAADLKLVASAIFEREKRVTDPAVFVAGLRSIHHKLYEDGIVVDLVSLDEYTI